MPKTSAQARPTNLTQTLRRLLSYMGHAKFSLLAVGVLASVAAIASLAGTYMVRPIVNGLATGGEELLAKQVILTAIIYAAGVLSALGYSQIMVRAAQRVVSDIRRDLFAHIQTLPLSYFDSTRSGDIMSFFTNDVDTVSEALNNSFANVIQASIQVVGTTAMLIILNWQLTIITLVCDAAIVLYARYSGARSKRFFAAQQASLGDLDGYIEEMVSGQKVIKVFNHEQANVAGFDARNQELRRTGGAAQAYANSMVPMTVVIGYVNYAIVAVAGGMLCIKGLADVGALASYLVFVRQAAMPINQFTQLGNFLLNALAGAERLFAAMDLEPEVDEGCVELVQTGDAAWAWKIPEGQGVGAYGHLHDVAAVNESGRAVAADGTELTCGLVPLAGDVRFHAVDFSYVPGTRVLTDLNLFAKPGQKIAFVGSTGAGKTTITNLINRFYEVDDGEITYDGIDVKHIAKASLRGSLGIVLQDTHLFSGTIAQNIRFGKLDATDEEVRAAAVYPPFATGLRHAGHGRRRQPVAGPAPTARHRARGRCRPAGAHLGRGHELHRHAYRKAHRARYGPHHARTHHVYDRAPPVHRPRRRRHHGPRTRPHYRTRHPRGAARSARRILAARAWLKRVGLTCSSTML